MNTTLAIDDDVLAAAKVMAEQQDRSVGQIISGLARQSFRKSSFTGALNGVPLLTPRFHGVPITSEVVNTLRDELP